jgi:hypothetical protein
MSFHHRHPRTPLGAVVAGLLLVTVACTSDDVGVVGDAATTTPTASAGPGAPPLGRCYRMTDAEADQETHAGPPVDCASPHQTRTYHVGVLPRNDRDYDSDKAGDLCTDRLPGSLGITQEEVDSSVLGIVYFGPSAGQWADGARWVRCDVAAFTADGLGELPDVDLSDGLPDSLVRCLREVARSPGYVEVTCDEPHDYRWAGSFEVAGSTYPGDDVIRQQAAERCPQLTGGDDWYAVWQDPVSWSQGFRRVECFGPASTV